MGFKLKISSIFLLTFFILSNMAFSQADANKMAKIKLKGMFIYSFAKNVYWPQKHSKGDFVVAVYGDKDIFNQLNSSYTDKLVGNQKIKVKFFNSLNEINECHMLFVSKQKSSSISQIKNGLSQYTLLVSEGENLASTGSMINFIYIQSRLKFQVNKTKAEKNDLKIGQTLTKLAHSII